MCVFVHSFMHTYMCFHTFINTHTHTHIHKWQDKNPTARPLACDQTISDTLKKGYAYYKVWEFICIYTCVCACVYYKAWEFICVSIYIYIGKHILHKKKPHHSQSMYTYIHTYIHTHIHTCIHTHNSSSTS